MRIVIITKISVKRKITLLFSQAIPWIPIFGPFTNNGMSLYYFNIKLVLLFSSSGTSIALFLRYCKYANLHNYKDSLNSMEWFYQSCADKIFQYYTSVLYNNVKNSKIKSKVAKLPEKWWDQNFLQLWTYIFLLHGILFSNIKQ